MDNKPDNLDLLVIEDNPADAFLLRKMLRGAALGINKIHEVDRLEKGLDFLKENEVHLILLDLSLPDSSGLNSLRGISLGSEHIPVIILTGLSDTKLALEAIKAGAKDYLVKGEFNEGVLVRTIQYTLERIKLEKKLEHEQKSKQSQVTRAVMIAGEKERRYVGQELHDNVNQVLTTVKLYLDLCLSEHEKKNELIGKSAGYVQMAIEEIRRLSKKLVSPDQKRGSLPDLLSGLIDDIVIVSPLKFELDLRDLKEELIEEDLKIALYRIAQEQLKNILKYAEATSVKICSYINGDQLTLLITDDGKGFDLVTVQSGVGIISMNSRAEAFNGKLEISTAPGAGCTLKVVFDLKRWQHSTNISKI